jgi:hypothetical protein
VTRREKISTSLLKPINPSFIIVLSLYTIVWGLWLLSPFWTVFSHAAVYSIMANIAPEWGWGLVALASGLAMLRGVLHPAYSNLLTGSCVGFFYWLIVAIFYFAGDWMNTGGITAVAACTYCALIWLNIKVNHRYFNKLD